MRTALSLAVFFALITLAAAGEDDAGLATLPVPFERDSGIPPAVSIYYNPNYAGIGGKLAPAVVVCIWPDGRAVWSRDHIKGGPPYFTGYIEPKRLIHFFDSLDSNGVFAHKFRYLVATDAPEYDIDIIDGRRRVGLVSTAFDLARKLPAGLPETMVAYIFLRHKIERLLPRHGRPLRTFDYEMRMGSDDSGWTKSIF